jgi:DNA-binding NtrC family response regulator
MNDYSNIRVLIVDEESAVRERLSAFLKDYGFETATCAGAKEARDLMYDHPFDVCITELHLPGLSGEDLIDLASKRFPDQRYIIHTDNLSYILPAGLKAIGMRPEHVFHKPVRVLSLLVKCVKELVETRDGPQEEVQEPGEN